METGHSIMSIVCRASGAWRVDGRWEMRLSGEICGAR